jgi:hypothetical protein
MASEPSRDLTGTTMSCRHFDDLVIVVHQENLEPSDHDWAGYVAWCKGLLQSHHTLKVLVVAGAKSPTSKQRSLYNQEIPGERVRIAVLITGRHVLVIVKIFAWFVGNIQAFDRNELQAALRYLRVEENPAIASTIAEFRDGTVKARSSG